VDVSEGTAVAGTGRTEAGRINAVIAESPSMIQLLTPDGARIPHPDYPLDISDEELRALLRDLVLVRRIDAEAIALQRQGELGLWPSALGQEAAQIGAGRALAPQDMVFPTYREHGVTWCRDIDPLDVLELFRGTSLGGGWDPTETKVNLYTLVIGSQTLHSVGYAMGVVRDGEVGSGDDERDTAVLAFFGDGATSQGDVNEAFVWAAAATLPVVFFCQNNQWAISVPVQRQSRVPLYQRAAGFGFPGLQVDGNDVLACLAVTRKALADARSGQGPTLIEAVTYRMGAHTTSDDPTRYRDADEEAEWGLKDPIARLRTYLLNTGVINQAFLDALSDESDALASRLRSGTRALIAPDPLIAFEHVYAEPTAELLAQREEMEQFLDSFDAPERVDGSR
jgi:2-oxoisovalerate dehydrogenase E1 component alpha subunit